MESVNFFYMKTRKKNILQIQSSNSQNVALNKSDIFKDRLLSNLLNKYLYIFKQSILDI